MPPAVNPAYKLSPSDFAFLYQECPRCYWRKVKQGFARPYSPMPKIFNSIDALMKSHFAGREVREYFPHWPNGTFAYADHWVHSREFETRSGVRLYIKGKFDVVARFHDPAEGYAVVDFKTSERNPEHLGIYSRQLNGYAVALENAVPSGKVARFSPVSRLGILAVEPVAMRQEGEAVFYQGHLASLEIPRDDDAFRAFLDEVGDLLAGPMPDPSPRCAHCAYLRRGAEEAPGP